MTNALALSGKAAQLHEALFQAAADYVAAPSGSAAKSEAYVLADSLADDLAGELLKGYWSGAVGRSYSSAREMTQGRLLDQALMAAGNAA